MFHGRTVRPQATWKCDLMPETRSLLRRSSRLFHQIVRYVPFGRLPARVQALSRQPDRKIARTVARHTTRKPMIAAKLTTTSTSDWPKKLQRNPLIR